MRVGYGFDIHRFRGDDIAQNIESAQSAIVIGGVTIPFNKCLEAHSDGDVLLHAVCDALLGAAGLGDIGRHFPNTDEKYRGVSSRMLLRQVYQSVKHKGFKIINMDSSIVAESPKMMPYVEQMRLHIAEDLLMQIDDINIKATTNERLGSIGRGEGIAVHSVVCLGPS